jgi:hypothetical protein
MKIFFAAVAALSSFALVDAAGEDYCYDPTDKLCGPLIWDQLDIPDNQCGGSRNSPIAIETEPLGECEQLDYKFDVRIGTRQEVVTHAAAYQTTHL